MAEVVQTITSECGRYRALVLHFDGGPYRVEIEQWREEWVPDYGKVGEGWSRITEGATYGDTLERAAELAEEELRLAVSRLLSSAPQEAEPGAVPDPAT